MNEILLELSKDALTSKELETQPDIFLVKSDKLDGESITQLLVSITTISLPFITKIILENIRANKHVVVKKNGITIKGLNAKNAVKVLKELSDDN